MDREDFELPVVWVVGVGQEYQPVAGCLAFLRPSGSRARRTSWHSCGVTPRGSKSPITFWTLTSTSVSEVSRRTPHSRWPSRRATSSEVRTQSFSKSTRTTRLTEGSMYSAYFSAALEVSPL